MGMDFPDILSPNSSQRVLLIFYFLSKQSVAIPKNIEQIMEIIGSEPLCSILLNSYSSPDIIKEKEIPANP